MVVEVSRSMSRFFGLTGDVSIWLLVEVVVGSTKIIVPLLC